MTANLQSARKAIEAELSYSQQGIAYWCARAEALESALHQLEAAELSGPDDASGRRTIAEQPPMRRRARLSHADTDEDRETAPPRSTHRARGRQRRGAARKEPSGTESGLPTTGGDFWLSLITDQPQSAAEILHRAIATLGLTPDQKPQIQKLRQRVFPALAALVSAHKVADAGAGRGRRFFQEETTIVHPVHT